MAKKYYWLKLQKDFFKRHDIKIIKSMPNGKDYVVFYLMLMLESIDHEGALRFSDTIPYNEHMLATITDTNIDTVRSAMKILQELHMVEVLDDQTIYMNEVNKMLGSETAWAEKKRIQRGRSGDNVPAIEDKTGTKKDDVRQEIEKELEIELEIEKDIGQSGGKNPPDMTDRESLFDQFWKAYPKKSGKISCENWFKRKKPSAELVGQMIAAIGQQKNSKQWQDGYIKNPLTWLNGGCWLDELPQGEKKERSYDLDEMESTGHFAPMEDF